MAGDLLACPAYTSPFEDGIGDQLVPPSRFALDFGLLATLSHRPVFAKCWKKLGSKHLILHSVKSGVWTEHTHLSRARTRHHQSIRIYLRLTSSHETHLYLISFPYTSGTSQICVAFAAGCRWPPVPPAHLRSLPVSFPSPRLVVVIEVARLTEGHRLGNRTSLQKGTKVRNLLLRGA